MMTYFDAFVPYHQRELIAEAERRRLVQAVRAASRSARADGEKSPRTCPAGAPSQRIRVVSRFTAAARRLVAAVR
jgi:hypothetical protein